MSHKTTLLGVIDFFLNVELNFSLRCLEASNRKNVRIEVKEAYFSNKQHYQPKINEKKYLNGTTDPLSMGG
eukprot:snap_masked-scaffold_8-processed-gene-0.19-mRNA-1 protein AED:1.00 eAED:1.00 QI:0/-1/0/0/-1/1/1/0/70